jgi:hypothetical protein
MQSVRFSGLALLYGALAALALGLASAPAEAGRPRPALEVTSPTHGIFSTGSAVTVTGRVYNVNVASTVVTINGSVVPLQPDGSFSYPLALNPSIVFNPIETRVVTPFLIDRRVVIAGPSVADGDFSFDALALRLNDTGLDQLEPVVTSLVDLDLATLLPAGTLVIDNYCYATIIVCIGRVDAVVEGTPPPSIGSFGINVDSQAGSARGDVNLQNLFVRARVFAVSGIGFTCYVTIQAATTQIQGTYTLEPLAAAPENVDVAQLGSANVVFGGFSDSTDCAGFLGGVVEFFIDLLVGDIQDLMEPAFEDFLNAQDENGNTPVAGAIETALQGIEIAGPIGEGLNVVLDAPLFQVAEDATGITLGADARVLSQVGSPGCIPPAGTAELAASYHVNEPFPIFGANTPGGLPYHLGIGISTSAFNQLLKAQIECGLLQTELSEFSLGGPPLALTAGLLSLLLPEFGSLPFDMQLVARIQPSLAPVLTGEAGPAGELTELRMGQLTVDIRDHPSVGVNLSFLKLVIDFRVGLDFDFDGETGELLPTISAINQSDVLASVASSYFGTVTPEDIQLAVPILIGGALPILSSSLGSFPIPSFFGFQLVPVETGLNGEFLSIFADLQAAP